MNDRIKGQFDSIKADITLLFKFKRLEKDIPYREENEPITKEEILFAVNCIRGHCDAIEKIVNEEKN